MLWAVGARVPEIERADCGENGQYSAHLERGPGQDRRLPVLSEPPATGDNDDSILVVAIDWVTAGSSSLHCGILILFCSRLCLPGQGKGGWLNVQSGQCEGSSDSITQKAEWAWCFYNQLNSSVVFGDWEA